MLIIVLGSNYQLQKEDKTLHPNWSSKPRSTATKNNNTWHEIQAKSYL